MTTNSNASKINTLLNIILLLTVASFVYVLYKKEELYDGRDTEAIGDTDLKINIPLKQEIVQEVDDYNHIRQRKVRREIKDSQTKLKEHRKKIEEKHSKTLKERQAEVEAEGDKEYIISLDSEANRLIAELTNLKQKGILTCQRDNVGDKLIQIEKIIQKLTQKIDKVDRGHQKIILLREYKDKLDSC